jgi:hypothetical protein
MTVTCRDATALPSTREAHSHVDERASPRRQLGTYHGLPRVRTARTASVDLRAREGPVEAVLALTVHRGVAS